jgi:hypothetical protein
VSKYTAKTRLKAPKTDRKSFIYLKIWPKMAPLRVFCTLSFALAVEVRPYNSRNCLGDHLLSMLLN